MSTEKVIDVREGDEFYADFYLCQIRGSKFRNFEPGGPSSWSSCGIRDTNPDLRAVSLNDAMLMLRMAGYTLTRVEAEKPECQPKSTSPVLTAERTEKPDHVPDAGKKVEAKSPLPDLPNANGAKVELDSGPVVKPDLTVDVPVVDAVWVEYTLGKGADAATCLAPYSNEPSARMCNRSGFTNGTARIVRIRSVDDESRSMIDDTRNTVRELDKAAFQFDERLAALESRFDTLETNVAIADARLVQRLEKVEKDKPAARVVKAPIIAQGGDHAMYQLGAHHQDTRWRAALKDAGITVADEGSST